MSQTSYLTILQKTILTKNEQALPGDLGGECKHFLTFVHRNSLLETRKLSVSAKSIKFPKFPKPANFLKKTHKSNLIWILNVNEYVFSLKKNKMFAQI